MGGQAVAVQADRPVARDVCDHALAKRRTEKRNGAQIAFERLHERLLHARIVALVEVRKKLFAVPGVHPRLRRGYEGAHVLGGEAAKVSLHTLGQIEGIRAPEDGRELLTEHAHCLPARARCKQGYGAGAREAGCMATTVRLNWGRIVSSGILAGLAGGVCFDLFIYAASLLPAHASILSLWQSFAAAALGKTAYTSGSYVWAGLVLNLLASAAWGCGYAYMAQTKPAINKQPIVSGFIFGLIVYVVMQFVLFSVQELKVPDVLYVYIGVAATTFFFGVPIAFVARVK